MKLNFLLYKLSDRYKDVRWRERISGENRLLKIYDIQYFLNIVHFEQSLFLW